MQEKPRRTSASLQPSRLSIQTILFIGVGFILVMVLALAVVGYLSLQELDRGIQANFSQVTVIRGLSIELQSELMLARQNESDFLTQWSQIGFDEADRLFAQENKRHIDQARIILKNIQAQSQEASDSGVQSISADVDRLLPLLDDYQDAFQATIDAIRERSASGGLESEMRARMNSLETGFAGTTDRQFKESLLSIRLNEQAFFAAGRQEYADNVRIQASRFVQALESASPAQLSGSTIEAQQAVEVIESYLGGFLELVALEQTAETNSTVFRETTYEINQLITGINQKSSSGFDEAQTQLASISFNSRLMLVIGGLVALFSGILAAYLTGRQIVIPLQHLSQAAEQFAAGRLSHVIELRGSREIHTLSATLNTMAEQLQGTLVNLENRVNERTDMLQRRSLQLQTAAEVARDAASTRELEVLLTRSVNLIRERFGFYHVGIFMVDKRGENLVYQAGTGEAGQNMLESGFALKIGVQGMGGFVAAMGKARIASDVTTDPTFIANPLLPFTRSEIVLPLKVGSQVIGVLDVQSDVEKAFEEADEAVLQIMADQIAISIDSTRLYEEAQRSMQELQLVYGNVNIEAWQKVRQQKLAGYLYDQSGLKPLDPAPEQAGAPYQLPLTVRGQTIAMLEIWPELNQLSGDELNMLRSVTDRVGQAMESARLFEEAQERALREQTLNQLVSGFTRSMDFDTLLQAAVLEMGRLPNIAEVSVYMGTPDDIRAGEDQKAS